MPRQLRDAYLEVAPHPENFELFFYKARDRMRDFQDAPEDAVRTIAAPTLVVGSDRDVMRPEGAVELFRLPATRAARDSAAYRAHGDHDEDELARTDDQRISRRGDAEEYVTRRQARQCPP